MHSADHPPTPPAEMPVHSVTRLTPRIVDEDDDAVPVKKRQRTSTAHLKLVPPTLEVRESIKAAAEVFASTLCKSKPFSRKELEEHGRQFLQEQGHPESYLGFAMVLLGNAFWRKQFLATPFEKRLLLLPHCLKHAEGCPAEYSQFGLDCEKCGACSIADYKVRAEQLGYKVLVAEGSPIVLRIIVEGYVDGILGVACLNVLEKAIDKVLIAGVPSYAVPLHSGDCKNTKMDEAWIWEVLDKYEPLESPVTSSYVPLMRAAGELFTDRFEEMLPRHRTKDRQLGKSPLGLTEELAYDWLANGGKRFRPFITLAAYDAASGGHLAQAGPGANDISCSKGVGRVAMAIEAFHKASLVHDDIQDDDLFRYGRETLHRQYGLGPAINIGDYLIGLGYRLIAASREEIDAETAADIVDSMSTAHIRLCDGQGAEMAWRDDPDWNFSPLDALQIYALKTSPAFEAALYAGLRLAGPAAHYKDLVAQFCRQVGVGFQILNDLKDWQADHSNKVVAGQDALALRPTLLLALALQESSPEDRQELRNIYENSGDDLGRLRRLREIFEAAGVFDKAERLVEKSRARAETLADGVENENLRQLLYFLIDTVLAPEMEEPQFQPDDGLLLSLPVVTV